MQLPDVKALKKLALACRKAGIKSFKGADFEFTLTEDMPDLRPATKKQGAAKSYPETAFESDTLSPEELLFYSVQTMPLESTGE